MSVRFVKNDDPTLYELIIGAIGSTIALCLRVLLVIGIARVVGVDI
jgi:hypothetical protein